MSRMKRNRHCLSFLTVLCLILGFASVAQAAKLYVSNGGLDSVTCGAKDAPCRSISRAIANASPGDTIIVGPGLYGKLNDDLDFDDPGEEAAEVGFGCFCMVKVSKQLTIESRDGAAATVLEAGGAGVQYVVRIEASGVVWGKKNKGFTLARADGSGLVVAGNTSGVRVGGNIADANEEVGFRFDGSGHQFTGNLATGSKGSGFFFTGGGHKLTSNVATSNLDTGFFGRGVGHVLQDNLATGNYYEGFFIEGNGHQLTGNSAVGNKSFGILIRGSATITKNNIFGNNTRTRLSALNCGLMNQSGTSLSVPNNFWGAATGPGTLATPQPDPADNVCDDSAYPGSSTNFSPFATKEFKVKTISPLEESGLVVPSEPDPDEAPTPASSLLIQFVMETPVEAGFVFRGLGAVTALRLEVMDLAGRIVYDSGFMRGESLSWARVNIQNKRIASGVYIYQLTARDQEGKEIRSELRKLIILK